MQGLLESKEVDNREGEGKAVVCAMRKQRLKDLVKSFPYPICISLHISLELAPQGPAPLVLGAALRMLNKCFSIEPRPPAPC